jgi:dihydroorotate dehydrogenase
VISNTTVARPTDLKGQQSQEIGGLSGKPLLQSSTALISDMFRLTKGEYLMLILRCRYTGYIV